MRLVLFLFFFISLGWAHQSSVNSDRNEIRWSYASVGLKFDNSSCPLGSSSTIVDQSISEWNAASQTQIQRVGNGTNLVKCLNDFSMYGSAVVGVTEVSYSASGRINSANVYLNEQDYDFVGSPGMPIGNNIYLGDVLTHELGHFMGLSHSEVLNSTMFYSNFPGQSSLAADDKAGIRTKYSAGLGKIRGYIKGGNDIGVLGVHVQAISRNTGEIVSGISQEDGSFEIGGLNLNDTYYIYTSSLKNLNALPFYYANVQTEFCPGSYVGSFYSGCGNNNSGFPYGFTLDPTNTEIDVGDVTINCTLRTQASYVTEKLDTNFDAISIWKYDDEPQMQKAFVGYFSKTELSASYKSQVKADKFLVDLSALSSPKILKIRLVSQPFGNPVEYQMQVYKNGTLIAGSPFGKSNNTEGTYNLDMSASSSLTASGPQNRFEIQVNAKKQSTIDAAMSIPDLTNFGSNEQQPYLLILSLADASGPLLDNQPYLSDNSACLDAPFTYAVANATVKSEQTADNSSEAAAVAGCGTIETPKGPGPGSFLGLMSTGFAIILFLSSLSKRRKNFLS